MTNFQKEVENVDYIQKILDEGNEEKNKISLEDFAKIALEYMNEHVLTNEVVKLANDIKELEHNYFTPPRNIYPLPEGYEYRFSGFFGQVLGICRIKK